MAKPRSNKELEAECIRLFQLAEGRLIAWEGAIATQRALEKQRDELAAALRAMADAVDDYQDGATEDTWRLLLQKIEQARAALARDYPTGDDHD